MSILSQKVFYAIHALLIMANQKSSEPIQIKEIVNVCKLSLKYMELVFSVLKKAGFVQSIRGSRGGYRLIKPLDQIFISDLVILFDGPLQLLSKSPFFSADLADFFVQKQAVFNQHLHLSLKELYTHQQKGQTVLNYSI